MVLKDVLPHQPLKRKEACTGPWGIVDASLGEVMRRHSSNWRTFTWSTGSNPPL